MPTSMHPKLTDDFEGLNAPRQSLSIGWSRPQNPLQLKPTATPGTQVIKLGDGTCVRTPMKIMKGFGFLPSAIVAIE